MEAKIKGFVIGPFREQGQQLFDHNLTGDNSFDGRVHDFFSPLRQLNSVP
jgi:hypothetical protein